MDAADTTAIISINNIEVSDRIRSELGDVKDLAQSIKENGLIQPIVLTENPVTGLPRLIAGGRRFNALLSLGITQLHYGTHWVWREADLNTLEGKLRFAAMELEENIKRKALTWQEEVLGKKRLLDVMQQIQGTAAGGGRTRQELQTGASQGFGVRKLSTMLGEAVGSTSQDLNLAAAMKLIPSLASCATKSDAMKKVAGIVKKVSSGGTVGGNGAPVTAPRPALQYRVLVYVDTEQQQIDLIMELETRGLKCQPIIV